MLYLSFLTAISGVAGFLGGLTGIGGIIMPPLMTGIYGTPPHVAMGMAQASYVLPSTLAVIMFLRRKQFYWRAALAMSIPGCLLSFFSAGYLKPRIDAGGLTAIFALCIMLSGAVMFRKAAENPIKPAPPGWRLLLLLAFLGGSVGFVAGITGSGSNAMLVPMMTFFGLEMLSVLGACQFFSVLTSASGTAGNILNLEMEPLAVILMAVSQLICIWFGVRLAQRLPTEKLKRYVGVICLLAGLLILVREVTG